MGQSCCKPAGNQQNFDGVDRAGTGGRGRHVEDGSGVGAGSSGVRGGPSSPTRTRVLDAPLLPPPSFILPEGSLVPDMTSHFRMLEEREVFDNEDRALFVSKLFPDDIMQYNKALPPYQRPIVVGEPRMKRAVDRKPAPVAKPSLPTVESTSISSDLESDGARSSSFTLIQDMAQFVQRRERKGAGFKVLPELRDKRRRGSKIGPRTAMAPSAPRNSGDFQADDPTGDEDIILLKDLAMTSSLHMTPLRRTQVRIRRNGLYLKRLHKRKRKIERKPPPLTDTDNEQLVEILRMEDKMSGKLAALYGILESLNEGNPPPANIPVAASPIAFAVAGANGSTGSPPRNGTGHSDQYSPARRKSLPQNDENTSSLSSGKGAADTRRDSSFLESDKDVR